MSEEDVIKEFHEVCIRRDSEEFKNLLFREKEIFVKRYDMNDGLHRAVKNESLRIVKLMLDLGVNVNKKERNFGATAFLLACAKGNLPIAEVLLENGADINAIVKYQSLKKSPLHYAVFHQNAAIAKLLLENGCKTEVRNQKGLTGFEEALAKGCVGIVKLIAFHEI